MISTRAHAYWGASNCTRSILVAEGDPAPRPGSLIYCLTSAPPTGSGRSALPPRCPRPRRSCHGPAPLFLRVEKAVPKTNFPLLSHVRSLASPGCDLLWAGEKGCGLDPLPPAHSHVPPVIAPLLLCTMGRVHAPALGQPRGCPTPAVWYLSLEGGLLPHVGDPNSGPQHPAAVKR